MQETIIVTWPDGNTSALPLPYFAVDSFTDWTDYYQITGEKGNLKITVFAGMLPAIVGIEACQVSPLAVHCSESVFLSGLRTAWLDVEEKVHSACKSVKPAAPFLTEKV